MKPEIKALITKRNEVLSLLKENLGQDDNQGHYPFVFASTLFQSPNCTMEENDSNLILIALLADASPDYTVYATDHGYWNTEDFLIVYKNHSLYTFCKQEGRDTAEFTTIK